MISRRMTLGGGALIALALLFIGLTVLFSHALRGWRVDLTENKLYTVAPGTERVLQGLKEPINVYFFFTESSASQYPRLKAYGDRVREFLQELAARSNGKLRLSIVEPQPFSEDEDRAAELGVRPVPMGSESAPLYFGLAATNSTDGREAIPVFDPNKEEFLEYEVVKLIHQLSNPKKPVLGWLSGLPMTPMFDPMSGRERELPLVLTQAQQLFDVRMLDAQKPELDSKIDVAVVIHPKDLSPAAQFALDQYALNGGHVIAFVDPIAEQDPAGQGDPQNPMAAMGADKSSNLAKLLPAWGVEFDPKQVVGDLELALEVGMRQGAPPSRHLGILGLGEDNFSRNDVVTSGLSNVNVATAGFLKPRKGVDVKFEPLLQSSQRAAPLPSARFAMLFEPESLLDGFRPTGERYAIGARVTGKVKTAFPEGPPEGAAPVNGKVLKESSKPLNLIVIADTDILSNFLWVRMQNLFGQQMAQAFAHNGDLVLNAFDNLAGSDDLISVRGRSTFTRPFKVVDDQKASAEARFRAKEQELQSELSATEQKLTALESARNDQSSLILTPEQEKELVRFQEEKLRIRKELRAVRSGLDEDIRGLGGTIKFVNIVLVPLIFALVALGITLWRRRRRETARRALMPSTAKAPEAAT